MSRRPADHTRLANNGELAYCTRCGAAIRLPLPMRVSEYADKITAFAKEHRKCTPAPVGEPLVNGPIDQVEPYHRARVRGGTAAGAVGEIIRVQYGEINTWFWLRFADGAVWFFPAAGVELLDQVDQVDQVIN